MANNNTEVLLLNVPFSSDYKHTPYFATESDQAFYMMTRFRYSISDSNYQRKDNVIRYPKGYDQLTYDGVNYVAYRNKKISKNKWYYAFVTEMKYVSDEVTDIYIQTDVIQTWMFDYTVLPSFVEREHTADDTVGANLVEETLQLGDYICNMHTRANYCGDTDALYIVVGATKTYGGDQAEGTLYDNIYSGLHYYVAHHTVEGAKALNAFLKQYDENGAGDAIQCMFLAPEKILNYVGSLLDENKVGSLEGSEKIIEYFINYNVTSELVGTEIEMSRHRLDEYEPRNKKLLTYPFRYLLVANNGGVSVPYRYEFFDWGEEEHTPKFKISGCLTPGCSVRMVPMYYKGVIQNDEEGINLSKFPALNWNSDVYTNWLTQNAVNIGVSIASDTIQTGIGIAGGIASILAAPATGGMSLAVGLGLASTAVSGVSSISSTVGEVYKASLTPPQSKGNTNAGDVITATGRNDFHFYDMTINAETAKIIDGYFDMFGYKTNQVKTPNVNHRESYWFTKTIDANIQGAIPAKDLQEIKNCYNNGITFWKDTENFGDYSLSNTTV